MHDHPVPKHRRDTGAIKLTWLILALALAVPLLLAQRPVSREYDLKAAFLLNFATFGEWPIAALPDDHSPFVIGVLGQNPFGRALDEIVRGENIRGHPVVIRRVDRLEALPDCHILFISASEKSRLARILRYCRERPILLVADMPGFAEAGGMIGFVTEGQVTLVVNLEALRTAQLSLNSKLLRLARIVPLTLPAP